MRRFATVLVMIIVGPAVLAAEPNFGGHQDVRFLLGCWSMRNQQTGEEIARLHVYAASERADAYESKIELRGNRDPAIAAQFTFARDGSWLTRIHPRDSRRFFSGRYVSVPSPPDPIMNQYSPHVPSTLNFTSRGGTPATVLTIEYWKKPLSESILIRARSDDTIRTDFDGTRVACN